MATITIKVENIEDAAQVCREVAKQIEKGYLGGFVGCSSDSWEMKLNFKP